MKLNLVLIILIFGDLALLYSAAAKKSQKKTNPHKKLFEGDIRLPDNFKFNPRLRNAAKDASKLWPAGIVPYSFSPQFNSTLKSLVRSAMERIERATELNGRKCIKFQPKKSSNADFIRVENSDSCWAHIGRQGGQQTASIGPSCSYSEGSVMHELMHSLGFFHEQARPDRDQYVTIHRENILPGFEDEFKSYPTRIDHLNQPYDYRSIMHYRADSFAKDPSKNTITPKIAGAVIGQRDGLSFIDVKMVQLLYNCQVEADDSNGECVDQLDNCELYGKYACENYPTWANKYCPVTCRKCTGELKCEDKEKDCASMGKEFCTADYYKEWATENCAKYCELSPACETAKTVTAPVVCQDKVDHCNHHGGKSVCSTYRAWASQNCKKYCDLCPESDTDIVTCEDNVDDCANYDPTICTAPEYRSWVGDHCRKHCKLCTDSGKNKKSRYATKKTTTTTTTRTTTTPTTTSITTQTTKQTTPTTRRTTPTTTPQDDNSCRDKSADCPYFPQSYCNGGIYQGYMKANCQMKCGICQREQQRRAVPEPVCEDKDSNCQYYPKSDCKNTQGDYHSYMKVNCLNTCNLCHTLRTTTPKPTTTPTTRRTKSSCADNDANCQYYPKSDCTDKSGDYHSYMIVNCVATCNLCNSHEATTVLIPKDLPSPKPPKRKTRETTLTTRPTTIRTTRATRAPTEKASSNCVDIDANCQYYPKSDCKNREGDYYSYMKVNCVATCGKCGNQKTSTVLMPKDLPSPKPPKRKTAKTTSTTQRTTKSGPSKCVDVDLGCQYYPLSHCSDPQSTYHSYMKTNCLVTCGLCQTEKGSTVLTPKELPSPEPPKHKTQANKSTSTKCVDVDSYCEHYPISNCASGDYHTHMVANCKATCGLCNKKQASVLTPKELSSLKPPKRKPGKKTAMTQPTTQQTTKSGPTKCVDVDLGCQYYPSSHCTDTQGTYHSYMKTNCLVTCGLCQTEKDGQKTVKKRATTPATKKKNCRNKRKNCNTKKKSQCSAGRLVSYMKRNCALFCGQC